MASATFVAVGGVGFPGFGSAPGIPAGIANNDILLCFVSVPAAQTTNPAMPVGWTLKTGFSSTATNPTAGFVFWKRTTGTESAPAVTGVSEGGSLSIIAAWRGCPTVGDPFNAVGAWNTEASATTVSATGPTTDKDNILAIHFASCRPNAVNTTTWSTGPVVTQTFRNGNGNGITSTAFAGHGSFLAGGAIGTVTCTTNNAAKDSSSVVLALMSTDSVALAGGPNTASGNAVAISATTGAATAARSYVASVIPAMPYLTTGRTMFGTATPSLLADGRFRQSFRWNAVANDYGAMDLRDVTATQLLVQVGNEDGAGGDIRSGWQGSPIAHSIVAYRIQTSPDSTNGVDGTWTTVVTETANPYSQRSYVIPFTGMKWVKLIADGALSVDELEVWNASGGTDDSWAFLGDSITNRCSKRGNQNGVGSQPSFQELVEEVTNQYPHTMGAGQTGWSATTWLQDNRIDTFLADFPHVKNFAISLGTNNVQLGLANLPTFRSTMQELVNRIRAAGRNAYVARVMYSDDPVYGGPPNNNTVVFNTDPTNGIDAFAVANNMPTPPDLYTEFQANKATYFDLATDGIHPILPGQQAWNRLWTDSMVAGAYQDASLGAAATGLGATSATGSASASQSVTSTGQAASTGTGNASAAASPLPPLVATASGLSAPASVGTASVPQPQVAAATGLIVLAAVGSAEEAVYLHWHYNLNNPWYGHNKRR